MSLTAHPNSPTPFKFNQKKAIQAVAFLLKQKPDKADNYTKLLKLLYIADRESLQETGAPITGDKFVAMEHGTTLSFLYDLVRHRTPETREWDKCIEKVGYNIQLKSDPGNSKLCRYDTKKLQEVWDRHRDKNWVEVGKITKKFEEWQKNECGTSSCFIPLIDLLKAIGRGDWYKAIVQDSQDEAAFVQLFGEA